MKIVIFGTGNAGRAIYRTLKKDNEIVAFIENNSNLHNSYYDNILIKSVNDILDSKFDKIAVAGVWADSMIKQLIELGVLEEKIWFIEDTKLTFSSKDRIETTDLLIKEFAKLMQEFDIPYFIEGSSLLCLLRGQNLSDVSDIDILITSKKDIEKIWEILNQNKIFQTQQLIKAIYKKDKILTKKDEIDKIIVKSSNSTIDTEATNLDINLAADVGDYYILDYEEESYHYYSKKFVGDGRLFEYKGASLKIPSKAEKYVEQAYGKNWQIPAKKWTYLDYKNILLTNKELVEFIKKSENEK